jgi:hypothetical protein
MTRAGAYVAKDQQGFSLLLADEMSSGSRRRDPE